MAYDLQKLTGRHKVMVSLVIRGYTRTQIAQAMGLTPGSVGLIINCGAFQNELARRQTEIERLENDDIANNLDLAKQLLAQEALPSVMKLAEIRENSNGDLNLARAASNDILKAAFGTPVGAGGGGTPLQQVVTINAEKMQVLLQIAKEAGIESGNNGQASDNGRDSAHSPVVSEEPVFSR